MEAAAELGSKKNGSVRTVVDWDVVLAIVLLCVVVAGVVSAATKAQSTACKTSERSIVQYVAEL